MSTRTKSSFVATTPSTTRGVVAGIGALGIIALVLIGIPAILIGFFGNPLPTTDELAAAARLEPDWGNRTLLGVVLPCVTWIAWALFAVPLLSEIVTRCTGLPLRSTRPIFGTQTRLANALVAAALFSAITPTFPVASTTAQAQTSPPAETADSSGSAHHVAIESLSDAQITDAVEVTAREQSYHVKSGDTLWSVADHYLGSGTRYPAIAAASADIKQPDGRHLTDPDLILPGWRLDVPTAQQPTTHSPAPAPAPAPAPSNHPAPAKLATPPAADPDGTADQTQHPQAASSSTTTEPSSGTESSSLLAAGGVAAVLAASLLAALRLRRRRQRGSRRIGERVALPAAAAENLEQQLTAKQDPDALDALDWALAHLQAWTEDTRAALPELFAIRVDDQQITAYLARPAELPAPFRPAYGDNTAWTAPRTAFDAPLHASVAPYPALVTVGTDQDEGLLLLDLEQLGVLSITGGNDDLTRAALNAMTAELASVPWANDLHLSLVGVPADLPFELDPYRIHHVTDIALLCRDLRTHLADRHQTLLDSKLASVREARVLANDIEAWAPFVALIATALTPAEHDELMRLARDHGPTGLVIVYLRPDTDGGPAIELHSAVTASYQSGGTGLPALPFTPQLLNDTALTAVLELFAVTNHPASTPPADPEAEDARRSPASPPLPTSHPDEHAGVDDLSDAATSLTQAAIGHAPYIRMLGPVDALQIAGPVPLPGRGIEFLAYLLTHQQPIPGAQIQKALWPNTYDRANNNTRTLAKQVRSTLGHDTDGHLWLPEGRGSSGFTLHPALRSDWHDFTALTGGDPTNASTQDLEAALRLVRGQPLLGTEAHRGRWAWRAPLEEEMIAAVLDAAEGLAERAILVRDRRLLRLAAQTARIVEPLSELSWQIELRAAASETADVDDLERIIDDLFATAGNGDPDYEPDATTAELIVQGRRAVLRNQHQ